MQTHSERVLAAAAAGEVLISVRKFAPLKHIGHGTVHRWINSGKLIAARLGRNFYSTPSLLQESLLAMGNPTPKKSKVHQSAIADLKKSGLADSPLKKRGAK